MASLRCCSRWARAVLIVGIAGTAGCWSDPHGVFPGIYRLPPGRAPLPESFWQSASAHAGEQGEGFGMFPVPGYYRQHVFWLDASAQVADYQAAGAYGPWLGLPFYQGVDERVYTRDGRVLKNTVQWTPFLATTNRGDWPPDRLPSEAWGVPLFFTVYRDYAGFLSTRATGWQTLWTLGPSYFRFTAQERSGGSGYSFHPLTAAGFGDFLWSSYCVTWPDHSATGHGPLFGFLGYYSTTDLHGFVPGGHPFRPHSFSMLALGSLWFSYESRSQEGMVIDAINGPLWGMFGPGYWNGEPVFRMFWMPIWV